MKYALFFITIINILLFGCMKSQIKDSLITNSQINKPTTITILSNNMLDENFARCLQKELKEDLPNFDIIPADKFRNALFPWFEYSTAPQNESELSTVLGKTLVQKQIETLGVEILIYVQGETIKSEWVSFDHWSRWIWEDYFGYMSADRETHIATTIWNLKKLASIGTTEVQSQGTASVTWIPMPIPVPATTEIDACSETAKRISDCLNNNDSFKDK